jgi:hypothetical protein
MKFNKKHSLTVGVTSVILLLIAGCSATEPYPFDSSERPSLHYKPDIQYKRQMKYPLTLGVINAIDRRNIFFYDNKDDYFSEKIPQAVSNMLFSEMKTSGLFKKVVRINEFPPEKITRKYMNKIRKEYKVDMILYTDLTRFNMLREKAGKSVVNTFKISVDVGFISQLIYLKNGYVVWADSVDRQNKELAKDGALESGALGKLADSTMKSAIGDVKVLILKTGKSMRRK